jgi:uncharacterized membrane protein
MAFVYLLLGVVILFTDKLLLPVNNSARMWFGILLLTYGTFRIYSLVSNAKRDEAN